MNLDEPGDLSGDDFLTAVYRHLYQVFSANFGMGESRFRQMFTGLFHEQDRPYGRLLLMDFICRIKKVAGTFLRG